jgi:FkbM family methyltransferase
MSLRDRLLKPEYLYRLLLWRRLWKSGVSKRVRFVGPDMAVVRLPWNLDITVSQRETLGRAVIRLGVYDLAVSEALFRLIKAGDSVVDVGANIGYMTGIMAVAAGSSGRVEAFEPHPTLKSKLSNNVWSWSQQTYKPLLAGIGVRPEAVSDQEGETYLEIPDDFTSNNGLAFLVDKPSTSSLTVRSVRLDSVLTGRPQLDLLKVDVEGAELQVFQGAVKSLSSHTIRNIIFEEHRSFPTPVTTFLQQYGYTIFQLGVGLLGPLLGSGSSINKTPRRAWEPRSMLASLQPNATSEAFSPRGWRVLRQQSLICEK